MTLSQTSIDHNPDDFIELYSFLHTTICYYKIINNIIHIPTEFSEKKETKVNFEDIGKSPRKDICTLRSLNFSRAKRRSKSPIKSNLSPADSNSIINQLSSASLLPSKEQNKKAISLVNKEENPTLHEISSQDEFSPPSIDVKKIAKKNPAELVLRKLSTKNLSSSFSHSLCDGSKIPNNQNTSLTSMIKLSPTRLDPVKLDSKELSQNTVDPQLNSNNNNNTNNKSLHIPLSLNINNSRIINKSPMVSPKIKIDLNNLKTRNQYSKENNLRFTSPVSTERIKSHSNLGKREIQTERQKVKEKTPKISKHLLTLIKKNEPIMESIEELSHREKNEDIEKFQKVIIDIRAQTNKLIFEHQRQVFFIY